MGGFADGYERSAEYIDIMIRPWWEQFGPVVAAALEGVPGGAGALIDIGAGGGQGTELLARTPEGPEVLAVEPSPGLRAVLLARVAAAPELRERVTVQATDLLAARLPDRLAGGLALNVIGHFSPEDRTTVFAALAERLVPGGRLVLNLQPPTTPVRIPRSPMSEVRIGRRDYVGTAAAEPSGADRITWHMRYEVREGAELISAADVDYDWWLLDEAGLRAEAAAHGLDVAAHGPAEAGIFVLTPAVRG